jgi:hypothetical protein
MREKIEFPVVGRLVECGKCKRKILVERALMGVDHTLNLFATCWDCLKEERKDWARKRYGLKG